MIEVNHLTKVYGHFPALNDISFKIAQGEIVGFLGPNGAGKTTTMRILTGFYPPTTGTAFVAGHSVTEHPEKVKAEIGYLPETPPLYFEMTVESYLKFVSEIKKVPSSLMKSNLEWALEKCGLKERRKSIIGNLSKGYRQRVGLAQAIIHKPKVIILDEPTVGLDPLQILEIRDLIKSFAGEHTVMLSTHILSEVMASCDRAIMIHRGRIVEDLSLKDGAKKKSLEEIFIETITKDVAATPSTKISAA